jgi:hypothetical protein
VFVSAVKSGGTETGAEEAVETCTVAVVDIYLTGCVVVAVDTVCGEVSVFAFDVVCCVEVCGEVCFIVGVLD